MNLKIGLDLLAFTKKELGLRSTQKSLGFLLDVRVTNKDLDNAHFIWNEYEAQGLRHYIFGFIR